MKFFKISNNETNFKIVLSYFGGRMESIEILTYLLHVHCSSFATFLIEDENYCQVVPVNVELFLSDDT